MCFDLIIELNTQSKAETSAKAAASLGIGIIGVSIAFGLNVLTMAYAIGHWFQNFRLSSEPSGFFWAVGWEVVSWF